MKEKHFSFAETAEVVLQNRTTDFQNLFPLCLHIYNCYDGTKIEDAPKSINKNRGKNNSHEQKESLCDEEKYITIGY